METNAEIDRISSSKDIALVAIVERETLHALLAVTLLTALVMVHDDTFVLGELISKDDVDVVSQQFFFISSQLPLVLGNQVVEIILEERCRDVGKRPVKLY